MTARSTSTSYFDRWALTYDRQGLQALAYRPTHDAVMNWLDDARPSRVIEISGVAPVS